MTGFCLIDKSAGVTSHDVVNRVRRLTGERRVGHAGTLDPFATGLLIVGVGREATREFPKLVGLDKTYEAVFVLGGSSDTDDETGTIVWNARGSADVNVQEVEHALATFVGTIEQTPPAYSAIKIGGRKMYEAAREGKPLEAKPRSVTIHAITDVVVTDGPNATKRVACKIRCGSGTYIRAIARDLGRLLGTGGFVASLRRTTIGPFLLAESTSVDMLKIIPVNQLLSRL